MIETGNPNSGAEESKNKHAHLDELARRARNLVDYLSRGGDLHVEHPKADSEKNDPSHPASPEEAK